MFKPRQHFKPARTSASRINLVALWDWRAANDHLFGSDGALRWHLRLYRPLYVDGGALFEIGGRLFVDAERFESMLLHIGRSRADEGAA
jgi:hypothetical protein